MLLHRPGRGPCSRALGRSRRPPEGKGTGEVGRHNWSGCPAGALQAVHRLSCVGLTRLRANQRAPTPPDSPRGPERRLLGHLEEPCPEGKGSFLPAQFLQGARCLSESCWQGRDQRASDKLCVGRPCKHVCHAHTCHMCTHTQNYTFLLHAHKAARSHISQSCVSTLPLHPI